MLSLPVAFAALTLAGCDAATQIAGEAAQSEVRNLVATQCAQVAESAGIIAGRVAEVCECSADTFMADREFTVSDVSRERLEGIVNDCAAQTGPNRSTATPASSESY